MQPFLSLSVWELGSALAERVGPMRWVGVTNRIAAHGCVSTKWAIPVHTGGINGVRKQPCSPSITSDQDPFVS